MCSPWITIATPPHTGTTTSSRMIRVFRNFSPKCRPPSSNLQAHLAVWCHFHLSHCEFPFSSSTFSISLLIDIATSQSHLFTSIPLVLHDHDPILHSTTHEATLFFINSTYRVSSSVFSSSVQKLCLSTSKMAWSSWQISSSSSWPLYQSCNQTMYRNGANVFLWSLFFSWERLFC